MTQKRHIRKNGAAISIVMIFLLSISSTISVGISKEEIEIENTSYGDPWIDEIIPTSNDPKPWATSLLFDSNDIPHVIYLTDDDNRLIHTWKDDSNWQNEIIAYDVTASYISAKIDQNDRIHVAYGHTSLAYAFKDESGWNIQNADGDAGIGDWGYISLALDNQDIPHISYCNESNEDLKYATLIGTEWVNITIDSEGKSGQFTSIVVDSQNNIHISYSMASDDYTDSILKYAEKNGGVWNIETLEIEGQTGLCTSIDVDADDQPHIIHVRGPNDALAGIRHNWRTTDGVWHSEYIDEETTRYWWPSMIIDDANNIHTGYSKTIILIPTEPPYYDFKYACYNGDEWEYETAIDGEGYDFFALGISINLNESGNPCMSYVDLIGQNNLGFVYKPGQMNNPPIAPIIQGETNGNAGTEYEYTFLSVDPNSDNLFYFVDWGDGTYSGWVGPYTIGETANLVHTWEEEGTYAIKAKAKDIYGAESDWGYLEVEMPVNQPSTNQQLLKTIFQPSMSFKQNTRSPLTS